MRTIFRLEVLLSCVFVISAVLTAAQKVQKTPVDKVLVRVQTELGNIEIMIDAGRAPITAANFLRYVDGGEYDGGLFHRTVTLKPDNQPNNTVKIEVIQGGVAPEKSKADLPSIKLERTSLTGIRHKNGVISMARSTPDSATSDFFICIGDQPELDLGGKRNADGQGFAAFGKVTKGMDVVTKIHRSAAEGQALKPPIKIITASRIN